MFFAETDMLPGEEDPADVPRGYSLVSLPRKPRLQTNRRGGGIALLIRDNIEFVKSRLSSPDIPVVDLGSMWVIGAYIPPVTSRWQGWTDVEPIEQLWETVALCTPNMDKPVLLLTDINGRTGSRQVGRFSAAWPRNSSDVKENTRGLAILEECEKYGLCILNGTSFETVSPGRYTSHQPRGQSTIDYGFVQRVCCRWSRVFMWSALHQTQKMTGQTILAYVLRWMAQQYHGVRVQTLSSNTLQIFRATKISIYYTRQRWTLAKLLKTP
jgi:hypothetical protein